MLKRKERNKALSVVDDSKTVRMLPEDLYRDLRDMIFAAREKTAVAVNAGLTMLYWQIGDRIRREVLEERRASYGENIVSALSTQLAAEFGSGFGKRNLFRMIRFAEVFPDSTIVSALLTQLGWSHFIHIIPFDDPLKREFYAEMCRVERWSTRVLESRINSMLYERTAISRKPDILIKKELAALRSQNRASPDLAFRDPYLLDFLGLKDAYSEKDLESAILREIESFILELGVGFAFVARQKRIVIDGKDHYIDLLFYHRTLSRLIAVELKIGDFKAEHKGQMELYLRWLEKHEAKPGEEAPLGLILCAGKTDEQVELLQLGKSGIRVSQYLTELPSKDILEKKLHHAIFLARSREDSIYA